MQWFIDMIVDICKAYTDQAILDAKVIPSGTIILWSGSTGTIPTGWIRCDGDNGTPDLRTRFVVGSGAGFPFGDTGGAATHTHGAGTGLASAKTKTSTANNLPPYYSLVYIQKL